MLAQSLPAEPCFLSIMCSTHALSFRTPPFIYPSNGNMGAWPHPNGGTEKSTSPARAPAESNTRLAGMQNLLVPHASLAASLSESTCSHIFCSPSLLSIHHVPNARTFFPHSPILIVTGVWGMGPHVYHRPLTFSPSPVHILVITLG